MNNREIMEQWVKENPNGYIQFSLTEIRQQVGMSINTVKHHLCEVIAERDGILPSEVMKRREEKGFKKVAHRLEAEKVKEIYRLDKQGVEPSDIAYILDIHVLTVLNYLKKGVSEREGISDQSQQ